MDRDSIRLLAEAITLKVLTDAAENSGPFVLEIAHEMAESDLEHVQKCWIEAFKLAEKKPPSLLILGDGMTLRHATDNEIGE